MGGRRGGAWRAAGTRPESGDRAFALLHGFGLAAVVAHLAGWPRRRTRSGLPWLEDCEGLGPELMPAYNTILYVSGSTALLATLRESRSAPVALRVLPCSCRHSSRRSTPSSPGCGGPRARPGWWNRRLPR